MYGVTNTFQEGNRIWHRKDFGDTEISQECMWGPFYSKCICFEGHRQLVSPLSPSTELHGKHAPQISTRWRLWNYPIVCHIPPSCLRQNFVVAKTPNMEITFLKKLWSSPQGLLPLLNRLPQDTSVNIKPLIKESNGEGALGEGCSAPSDDFGRERG